MLTGLNHLTLSVHDLDRSVVFYRDTLGLRLHARWERGAYLSAGDLWLCLSLDAGAVISAGGYTHYAFSIGYVTVRCGNVPTVAFNNASGERMRLASRIQRHPR